MSQLETAPAKIDMFSSELFSIGWEKMEKNRESRPKGWEAHWNECAICGKAINPDRIVFWIHMSGQGNLYPNDVTNEIAEQYEEGDMGSFPIGASCAKKIPATHRYKN